MLTVPPDSKVKIYTDSQACIDTYNRLNSPSPKQTHKRWLKEKNWSLWSIIIDTIKKRNIDLRFNKVKAHAGDALNEKADKLAKQATQTEIIRWNNTATYKIQALPVWNDIIIDTVIRNFIKEINYKQTIDKWTKQKRIKNTFEEQIQNPEDYDWKMLWTNISTKGMTTSFKDNKKKSFLLKLAHNELPTLDRLIIRRPDLYGQDKTCPLCNKKDETREHIFECEELKGKMDQAWKKTIEKLTKETKKVLLDKKEKTDAKKTANQEEEQIATFTRKFEERILGSRQRLLDFTIGLIEQRLIQEYKKLLKEIQPKNRSTTTKVKKVLITTSKKFQKNFKKMVWNYRCEKRVEIDKIKGIGLREKKNKPPSSTKKRDDKREKRNRDKTPKALEERTNTMTPDNENGVLEKIYDWIRGGIRWLGI